MPLCAAQLWPSSETFSPEWPQRGVGVGGGRAEKSSKKTKRLQAHCSRTSVLLLCHAQQGPTWCSHRGDKIMWTLKGFIWGCIAITSTICDLSFLCVTHWFWDPATGYIFKQHSRSNWCLASHAKWKQKSFDKAKTSTDCSIQRHRKPDARAADSNKDRIKSSVADVPSYHPDFPNKIQVN